MILYIVTDENENPHRVQWPAELPATFPQHLPAVPWFFFKMQVHLFYKWAQLCPKMLKWKQAFIRSIPNHISISVVLLCLLTSKLPCLKNFCSVLFVRIDEYAYRLPNPKHTPKYTCAFKNSTGLSGTHLHF